MAWRGRPTALQLTIPQFATYIEKLQFTGSFRPSGMVLHNTAVPSLERWKQFPVNHWLKGLPEFYKSQGWSSMPHAFVDDAMIYVTVDFNVQGTHTPSWNGTRLGIEMVADFAKEDDDEPGSPGFKVKMNTVALFALVHKRMGWDPETIKLHKEDPATDHDCPGKNIDKKEFIRLVTEYMGEAGEHSADWSDVADNPPVFSERKGWVSVSAGDTLNMRSSASASSSIVTTLSDGAEVKVKNEAKNGATLWYFVDAGGKSGWVAGKYVSTTKKPADEGVRRNLNIFATEFGGEGDTQASAYGGMVDPNKPGCALPFHFSKPLRRVRVFRGTKSIVCDLVDVGPWNMTPGDPYWEKGARPMSEAQMQNRQHAQNGQIPTNSAGIDLTKAALDALGVPGRPGTRSTHIDWEFVA